MKEIPENERSSIGFVVEQRCAQLLAHETHRWREQFEIVSIEAGIYISNRLKVRSYLTPDPRSPKWRKVGNQATIVEYEI